MRTFLTLVTLCMASLHGQTIPPIGDSGSLEICNWNLEWFGKTQSGYGPKDDVLQQKLVTSVLQRADIDIWAFCEVSEPKAFDSMMQKLPGYDDVLATYLPEQKTAVVFRKTLFVMASTKLLGTSNKDSFSTGRFPLEIALIPKTYLGIDTIFIIVLHLKANTGTDSEKLQAYNSRKRSSEWLKMYLGNRHAHNHCIVLGDWNDDLDESIFNGLPSPYTNLLQTGFPFSFVTKKLTDNGIGTTTSYSDPIDHQLVSSSLLSWYIRDSTSVWRLDKYISSYPSTCSDHYPVCSKFAFHRTEIKPPAYVEGTSIFPQPAGNAFQVTGFDAPGTLELYDLSGRLQLRIVNYRGELIDISRLNNGLYLLHSSSYKYSQTVRLIIQH